MKRLVPALCLLLAALCAWLGITVRSLSREADDLRDRLLSAAPDRPAVPPPPRDPPSPAAPAPLALEPTPPADAPPAAPVRPTLSGAPPAPSSNRDGPNVLEVALSGTALEVRTGVWSSNSRAITFFGESMRSFDVLEERLGLSPRQRQAMEGVVADAKRDLADLRRIPDEAGRTWEQVQRDAVRMEDGVRVVDDSEALAFRERKIPRSEETYGAAEQRILEAAKARMGESLDADQSQKFSNLDPTPILGPRTPGGPPPFVSVTFNPVFGSVDAEGSPSGSEGR